MSKTILDVFVAFSAYLTAACACGLFSTLLTDGSNLQPEQRSIVIIIIVVLGAESLLLALYNACRDNTKN